MSKRKKTLERHDRSEQTEGMKLELAREAAKARQVHLPMQLPSKYTRRGAQLHAQIDRLAQRGLKLRRDRAEEERRRQAEEARRPPPAARVDLAPRGPIPDALGLEGPNRRALAGGWPAVPPPPPPPPPLPPAPPIESRSAAPRRPQPRSGARLALALMSLGLGLGLGARLPPDPDES